MQGQELEFFVTRLAAERLTARYNDVTIQLVRLFQKKAGLDTSGEVRDKTATAMNNELDELGAFPGEPPPPPREYVIAGRVLDQSGTPSRGLRIVAYHHDNDGTVRLGADQSDGAGPGRAFGRRAPYEVGHRWPTPGRPVGVGSA
ncbi:hypothetical protein AB0368_05610 [Actinoplanes sp. NPDC051475]|uniref:hypothetical protein n=1 Tax=Actinoplanes sp. NPDC051475 TaxID=3157225 RepID=UPI00344E361B